MTTEEVRCDMRLPATGGFEDGEKGRQQEPRNVDSLNQLEKARCGYSYLAPPECNTVDTLILV